MGKVIDVWRDSNKHDQDVYTRILGRLDFLDEEIKKEIEEANELEYKTKNKERKH